jgi:DNA polymerase-1
LTGKTRLPILLPSKSNILSRTINFIDGILEKGRETGYVATLLNRRRYLPEINHGAPAVRHFAERTAIHAPIQETAADLIRMAMINIDGLFRTQRLKAGMIVQVHGELVFEAPQSEKAEVMTLVKKEIDAVIRLSVPLRVDIGSGRNRDEAHGQTHT